VIRRSVKFQLVAFALIIIAGVVYVGLNYVGVSVPGHGPYTVLVNLRTTGGLYTNAVVSQRGIEVGKVGSITLKKDQQGRNYVQASLEINNGVRIYAGDNPSNYIRAKVADLSAVGEQYLDLLPQCACGPVMGTKGPDLIPVQRTSTPVDVGKEVLDLNQLLTSVNDRQLSRVIQQLGAGFDHLGPILQHLIDNGDALTKAAIANLPSQLKLIDDGAKVLDTQNAVAGEFKSWARLFRSFSQSVDADDQSIRNLIDNGIPAATEVSKLLSENAPILPSLLDNLTTFQGIQAVRLPDVRAILELYPADTSAGFFVTPGNGTARFGDVNDSTPTCGSKPNTDGYQTPNRGNQPSDWGGSANLNSYCHGKNVKTTPRGSRNVPRLVAGDHTNVTGSLTGSQNPATLPRERKLVCPVPYSSGLCGPKGSGSTSASAAAASVYGGFRQQVNTAGPDPVISTVYDPKTGLVNGLDGKKYLLGYDGPTAPIFGSDSWEWLLLAPAMK
jgi:phospholipid/cholesterol/gamma-HCH transport system substrate-binding protein